MRLVLLSSVHIQPHLIMTTDTMNTLEHIAYVRLALQLMSAGCLLLTATLWLAALKDARK